MAMSSHSGEPSSESDYIMPHENPDSQQPWLTNPRDYDEAYHDEYKTQQYDSDIDSDPDFNDADIEGNSSKSSSATDTEGDSSKSSSATDIEGNSSKSSSATDIEGNSSKSSSVTPPKDSSDDNGDDEDLEPGLAMKMKRKLNIDQDDELVIKRKCGADDRAAPEMTRPQIAILGGGIFVRTQYIPRLKEIADIVALKTIWSRSEESAKAAAELARDFSPEIECKWGDAGLDDIIQDNSIHGVAVVLAGQTQVDISLKMLKAGKHVLQEKPAASTVSEAEAALSCYNSLCTSVPRQPIWAVAENYRFEPAFVESRKLINDIGDMMSVQVIVEGSMNSSNPYFSSSWRRSFTGGFILDMGVHCIAGLRMVVGSEVTSVSAISSHVDKTLPPPDTISALFQLENSCHGVFAMIVSSRSPKTYWRVVGSKGTVQVERGNIDGRQGYLVSFYSTDGKWQTNFYPFSGVNEELKAFVHDMLQVEAGALFEAEPCSSFIEGARDIAVLEAMLESGIKHGAQVHVKKL